MAWRQGQLEAHSTKGATLCLFVLVIDDTYVPPWYGLRAAAWKRRIYWSVHLLFTSFDPTGNPVSVCHQLSLMIVRGNCFRSHMMVSGSHLSPARVSTYRFDMLYFFTKSPGLSTLISSLVAVGDMKRLWTLYFSQIFQRMPASGTIGLPSKMTVEVPRMRLP